MPNHNDQGPVLTVDTRQPTPDLEVQVLRGLDIPAEKGFLATGDYSWYTPMGLALMESKEVGDLFNSMTSGRLTDQLQRLVDEAFWPFLLIKGVLDERRGYVAHSYSQLDFDALDNHLVGWQSRGVIIKHCPDPQGAPYRIASLYRWTQKQSGNEIIMQRRRRLPNLGRLSERAEVLAGLDGVGTRKAEAIASQGSLREVFGQWDVEKFAQATGSRKLAEKLVAFIEESA